MPGGDWLFFAAVCWISALFDLLSGERKVTGTICRNPGAPGKGASHKWCLSPFSPMLSEETFMIDPAQKALSLAEEFKNFALKGSVIDLAVGVVIGGAFGGIVKSLVDNIIMPLVSLVMPSDQGYKDWSWTVHTAIATKEVKYGMFLSEVVNFVILALVLFIFIVKFLGFITRTRTEAPPPALTKDQELLVEIRDLLKSEAK
jgi:large conductance mechanosensitive channel